jgi:hypothetical protein
MTKTIGRNLNVNIEAVLSGAISLNALTSTTIITANGNRIFFAITNNGAKNIWLKLQAASVDNDKKGIYIPKQTYWEMPMDNIYTGEISAISISGTPDIYYTEY